MMITLSKKSLWLKLYGLTHDTPRYPQLDLCTLVRGCLLSLVMLTVLGFIVALVCFFMVYVPVAALLGFAVNPSYFGVSLGLFLPVLFFTCSFAYSFFREKFPASDKPKKKSVAWEYIKAKKEKVCPIVKIEG